MSDVYVVVNAATTWDENVPTVARDSSELLELVWTVVDAETLEILDHQSVIAMPENVAAQSRFGPVYGQIWANMKGSGTFKEAVDTLDKYLQNEYTNKGLQFVFVAYDASILRVELQREARSKGIMLPLSLLQPRVFDLFTEYSRWQKSHPEALVYPATSLLNVTTGLGINALRYLPSTIVNGSGTKSTSPADGAKMAANHHTQMGNNLQLGKIRDELKLYTEILIQLGRKSLPIEMHPNVLTCPLDSYQDAKIFAEERSKSLFILNLPLEVIQSELEAWFSQVGVRPIAFWSLKNSDGNNKPGIGFVVFASHEEAAASLAMNGRALNDRAIEVQPSSSKVLDKASDVLTPFSLTKNRSRPGDWTCPSCGFSNFQRRTACFRCSFPQASAVAIQDSIYSSHGITGDKVAFKGGYQDLHNYANQLNSNQNNNGHHKGSQGGGSHVPFRAGDWKCTNEFCRYHNFAKNLCCLKCGCGKPSPTNVHFQSVNSTATAIAAATASGRPINSKLTMMPQQQTCGYYQQPSKIPGNQILSNSQPLVLPEHLAILQGMPESNNVRSGQKQEYKGQEQGNYLPSLQVMTSSIDSLNLNR